TLNRRMRDSAHLSCPRPLLTSPRPLRGEVEIRGQRISGEGQGTMPVANSAFADRRAPHPDPLAAKSGAREKRSLPASGAREKSSGINPAASSRTWHRIEFQNSRRGG